MEISTNIKERILYIADFKGIKKSEFIESLNQKYSNYRGVSKKSAPSAEVLAEISTKYPDVNINWVLTGQPPVLKDEKSTQQNISNVKGSVFANAGSIGNISFDNPSKDAMYQQEIYRLQSENDILRKSNEMLEREIVSFKSILDQQRESQAMVKELYERKITDLKENITLLKNLFNKE